MRKLSNESSKAILYAIMDCTGEILGSAHEQVVNQINKACIEFIVSNSRQPSFEDLREILGAFPNWFFTDIKKGRTKFSRLLAKTLDEVNLTFETPIQSQILPKTAAAERILLEDIDSFSKAVSISPKAAYQVSLDSIYEDDIKIALIDIIGERFIPNHSASEKSDLYTSMVVLRGKRVPTAFLLKSMKSVKTMDMKSGLGKRSNQILRLMNEPADLYIVQHTGVINTDVIDHLYAQVFKKATELQKTLYYYIMDGNETARILLGYEKIR
ncbi:MAG: hypothetical protein ACFFCT_13870 [Candidatus Odinarchaeota archaeon]